MLLPLNSQDCSLSTPDIRYVILRRRQAEAGGSSDGNEGRSRGDRLSLVAKSYQPTIYVHGEQAQAATRNELKHKAGQIQTYDHSKGSEMARQI